MDSATRPELPPSVTDRQAQDSLARARALEAAADARVYESEVEDAKVNYGWAIDTFLEERAFEEAIRICRKLIRLAPDVVRTRYTLLFLLIGLGRFDEAVPALEEYVEVVRRSGTRSYAVPRLQLLAHVTDDARTSERIVETLRRFGVAEARGDTSEHGPAADLPSQEERLQRWETLLPIALRDD